MMWVIKIKAWKPTKHAKSSRQPRKKTPKHRVRFWPFLGRRPFFFWKINATTIKAFKLAFQQAITRPGTTNIRPYTSLEPMYRCFK